MDGAAAMREIVVMLSDTCAFGGVRRTLRGLRLGRAAAGFSLALGAFAQPAGGLINLSTQATLTGTNDILTVGFVVRGETPKPLLVRGVGPGLAAFGVPNVLADPTLSLHRDGATLLGNDDWFRAADATQLAAAARGVGAFALGDTSRDAAFLPSLAAGSYSARVTSQTSAGGAALVEVYDASATPGAGLVNLSTLSRVGGASGTLTAGFVIGGTQSRRVLIRGVGPSLASVGVTGALTDPQLALFTPGQTAPLLQNDNWAGNATLRRAFEAAGAFAFAADNSRDAALVATLAPGAYTAQLAAVGASSGFALIEVYDLTTEATEPPVIAASPGSLLLTPGAQASLTVIAQSAAPANYQWFKDGGALAGATSDTLWLPSAAAADAGRYTVTVANNAGAVTSAPATVALIARPAGLPPAAHFTLTGFATVGSGTTGGGVLLPGDPNYRVLDATTPNKAQQLRTWLESATPLVVDVQVDVDLGALNNLSNRPRTSPELIASGLGVINVRANKTVFSSTGATLRHGALNISGQNNIIVRNLRFRGLWEFDEGSQNPPDNAPWGYKIQDWDYVTVQNNARNVWIDHCDFEKAYDGLADVKAGADLVTFSWCRFGGDTEGAVARQIAYLEKLYRGEVTDSRVTFTFYQGLRDGAYARDGIPAQSIADIVAHELPHDKTNLIGASDTETASMGALNVTFHHVYYHDCRQRLPRMRFGNAHLYNVLANNSGIAASTNQGSASTCDAALFAENSTYIDVAIPFPPVSGTSPAGRASQSGSHWFLRGQERSFGGDTFLRPADTWTWNTSPRNFSWSVAPAPNAFRLPYSYTADPTDYTSQNLGYIGVIVPATSAEQAMLASYLVRTQ